MAVYRIEKTKNHTVMSNYQLRSRDLSSKARLLSICRLCPRLYCGDNGTYGKNGSSKHLHTKKGGCP